MPEHVRSKALISSSTRQSRHNQRARAVRDASPDLRGRLPAPSSFYKKAFNATETSLLPGPNGRLMHASIQIGDSTEMLVDGMPQHGFCQYDEVKKLKEPPASARVNPNFPKVGSGIK
jgi:hypothetical protein